MNSINPCIKSLKIQKAAWFFFLFASGLPVLAAPSVDPLASAPVPRSVFTQPTSPNDGCDPFFPTSSRPYASAVVSSVKTTDLSSLVMQGISGSPEHRLAIINHVTFAVGDVAEVRTPQGRIQLHCIEISGNSAVVEANGQRQSLHYGDKP